MEFICKWMGGGSATNNNTQTKKKKRQAYCIYNVYNYPVWVLFSHVILIYKLIKLFTQEKRKANDNFTSTPME